MSHRVLDPIVELVDKTSAALDLCVQQQSRPKVHSPLLQMDIEPCAEL